MLKLYMFLLFILHLCQQQQKSQLIKLKYNAKLPNKSDKILPFTLIALNLQINNNKKK